MSTSIDPGAIVHKGAELGEGVEIGPFCEIGAQARIGAGSRLHGRVSVLGQTEIGAECELFENVVLGARPQVYGFAGSDQSRLEIGARVVFREGASAHPGHPDHGGVTRIGADGYFMIGAHIGHDCQIGWKCIMANTVALAGHIEVGEQVWMGGLAAIHQFSRIGDHAFIAGGAIVVGDIIPYGMVVGNRARLSGLNINGLKRRGFSRETLKTLRAAYRDLFDGAGAFDDRVAAVADRYHDQREVMAIVDFIRADRRRGLCMPGPA